MHPRLSIVAASIRRIIASGEFVEPTSDPYLDNVVLSLRMESSDPYYNQVVLGMHMDDAGLSDVRGHTVTASSGAAVSSTQSMFGGYSAYFDGTNDIVTVANSGSDFNFGTSDFTIEAWIRPNSVAPAYQEVFALNSPGGTNQGFFCLLAADELRFNMTLDGLTFVGGVNSSGAAISTAAFTHVAWTRESGTLRMFAGGIKVADIASTFAGSIHADASQVLGLASNPLTGSASPYGGYIDDLRITKGVARYTKNFSIPTAAFPEPANTAIDDTGKTVTTVGGAQFSGLSKYGSGSFYFDGAGDYLEVPAHANWSLGTNDFTLEAWVYIAADSSLSPTNIRMADIVVNPLDSGASTALSFGIRGDITTTGTGLYLYNGGAGSIDGTTTISKNAWHHLACSRLGGMVKFFLDGIAIGSPQSYPNSIGSASNKLRIGGTVQPFGYNYYLNGYIDDLRITKGIARYTANFTPYKILTNAPAGDPWYNYTALLLKMNGTNGSTTFTDESYTPKTMTVFGNSNISTAQLKYGTASGYFDGTGDYLRTPYDSRFDPGATGDYTAECWIYPTNVTSLRAIFGPYCNPSVTQGWILYQGATGEICLTTMDIAGTYGGVSTAAGVLVINQWQHIAWTKTGKVHKLWHNGIKVAEATDTLNLYVNPSYGFIIGRWDDSGTTGRDFVGYMDDVRLTKGIARYTATFQPPGPHIASIDPDTDQWWLNTVLAMRMDGTHGSTTFTDLKGKTVTTYGNASISSAISKFGQAGYFDGTTDGMSTPSSTDFDFGSGDYTLECWINLNATTTTELLIRRSAATWAPFSLYVDGTGLGFSGSTTGASWDIAITGTTAVSTGVWHHAALTRYGNVYTLWLDGTACGTTTVSGALMSSTSPVYIGCDFNQAYSMNGYLDDVRITKGIARYTAAFTPSEKPLPTYVVGPDHDQYWDKVVLACPFNSLVDERAHTITANGNATISATQKMFGGGSCYFDGTGDYLTVPASSDWALGSSDFTMEAWIRPTGYATSNDGYYKSCIVSRDLSASRSFSLNIVGTVSSFTSLEFTGFADNTTGYTSVIASYTFNLNTWYHVVATRSGNLVYIFIDGVCQNPGGTTFTRVIQDSTTTLKIGSIDYDTTYKYYFTGYIDDLRITKGVARYTANFELPTKANILG